MSARPFAGRVFSGAALSEVCFPLGGIGTGSIGLTGAGGLAEWQLFGRPDQDSANPHSGFAIWAKEAGRPAVARILEAPARPPYNRHHRRIGGDRWPGGGLGNAMLPGLPHVEDVAFRNQFPCACLDYRDAGLPVQVSLEAWSPFVPMDADASTHPAAVFEFRVSNPGRRRVRVSLAASLRNPVPATAAAGPRNRAWEREGLRGILFDHPGRGGDDPLHGGVLLCTPWRDVFRRTCWRRLAWFDGVQDWWESFAADGSLDEVEQDGTGHGAEPATLGLRVSLPPGASAVLPVWITWCFPTMEYTLAAVNDAGHEVGTAHAHPRWRHHYADLHPDAEAAARNLALHHDRLRQRTFAFRDALLATTADPLLIDAVQANLAILRSPTVLRLPNGTLYGYEGSHERAGSCPGSCMHVWNYGQAVPALFPFLERGMRTVEFRHSFSPTGSGAMAFRINLPLGAPAPPVQRPAADAQLGVVVRSYAAWRMSADLPWLRGVWPGVRAALEFAWRHWDPRREGVISGPHHNTYDVEFHGPDPMATGYYLAALEAGARLAEALGEDARARDYRAVAASGRAAMDGRLWNGGWYAQQVDGGLWRQAEFPEEPLSQQVPGRTDRDPDHQVGRGCLSDQLVGQWLGELAGLDCGLDAGHVDRALLAIHRHNFRTSMRDHPVAQRCFALGDEAGLLLCSWPKGGRPRFPMPYCDEVWPGIEYQVASHLIRRGHVREGAEIVRAVRARHDGVRRNPFAEFECGSWYARSMASFALLWAVSGADHDAPSACLSFAPRTRGPFSCVWSAQQAWGTIAITARTARLRVEHGRLALRRLAVGWDGRRRLRASLAGEDLDVAADGAAAAFSSELRLEAGDELALTRA